MSTYQFGIYTCEYWSDIHVLPLKILF